MKDEIKAIKEDPSKGSLSIMQLRGDGFQNQRLRTLTIAAFLRCLYGSIEYAPSIDLRNHAIQHVKDPLNFKKITQLCDATNWD